MVYLITGPQFFLIRLIAGRGYIDIIIRPQFWRYTSIGDIVDGALIWRRLYYMAGPDSREALASTK